ncbi:uncharacterized protein LOC110860175 [Folsomia candida]|uniref:Uncharacterized protein n=1 Tax=Folsomia candida TaxID=158441 RepID=A0A226DB98_FOLCA|nr:uncharacterized protein LOC110860175 [Folsomia candida]OXA41516.1 hypothetical protein Fcan01_23833 [Folsomia candida]
MATNPLPPNFGASIGQLVRDSLQAAGIGGGGQPSQGQPQPQSGAAPPPNPSPRGATTTRNGTDGRGGHRFEQCTGDITVTTEVIGTKPLTPAEEARARRGAEHLLRHESAETIDMTDEQLQRLVLLKKLRSLREKRRRMEEARQGEGVDDMVII